MKISKCVSNETAGRILEFNGYEPCEMFAKDGYSLMICTNNMGAIVITKTHEEEDTTTLIWCDDMGEAKFRFGLIKENIIFNNL